MGSIVNAMGRRAPVRISTALLRDAAGRIMGGVETFQDLSRLEQLCDELQSRHMVAGMVGRSPPMKRLFSLLPQIADSDSTVLIDGASGVGKELTARAIHQFSHRKDGRFVAVNTAAIPDSLLDSELFGYKAGAFTDAKRDKPGRFALADGGVIFLDEIGDMSPALQARLLRVLQERAVEPLGGLGPVKTDVRVIAATNKDLASLVASGAFREDLYYRIRVVHLKIPPLRERREDIPLLADHLVRKFNRSQGRDVSGVSDQAMNRLMEHDFPGNVRELENIIEQAFVLCRAGLIDLHHLPPELGPDGLIDPCAPAGPLTLKAMERHLIQTALQRCQGSRKAAAQALGVHPSTLHRKMRALNIPPPDRDGRSRS
jgi:transcriptional regulator with PAS, ATPase and Fis domain